MKARRDQRDTFQRRRQEIREKVALAAARPRAPASPAPRYDEVFIEGVRLLDELAGPPPSPLEAEAVFSADIWKSPTRGDPDVPSRKDVPCLGHRRVR